MLDFGPFSLTDAELEEYLGGRPRYAALASLRRDGSPIVIPLGYLYEGGYMHFTFAPDRSAVKRLRRDPRVAITVFSETYPVSFVVVEGLAEEIPDPDLELSLRKHRWIMQLAEGKIDMEEEERNHFLPGRVVFRVKVEPEHVSSMDMGKMTHIETQGVMTPAEAAVHLSDA